MNLVFREDRLVPEVKEIDSWHKWATKLDHAPPLIGADQSVRESIMPTDVTVIYGELLDKETAEQLFRF